MKDIIIAQDNRLTTARYELSLIEKRVFYYIIKEVRKLYNIGQRNLFDDLILTVSIAKLSKEINQKDNSKETKKALIALRRRSFEWDNGLPDEHEDHEWFEVGFINWSKLKNGEATVQVSSVLMPFLVELSSQFTPYSLNVAMSLKSKWSQRMYELCQKWQGTEGFRITVNDLRNAFKLEEKYNRYALLNQYVLQIAKKELKELYDAGQCDVYFEFTEERKGRTVETLRFKLFRKNALNVKTTNDMLLELIPVFQSLYNTNKMPKNDVFIKEVILKLQKFPELIEPLNTRIRDILATGIKEDTARYIRFILNEDIMNYKPSSKAAKTTTKAKDQKQIEKEQEEIMETILGLSDKLAANE